MAQAAFLSGVLWIARTFDPPPRLLPLDALAAPDQEAAPGARLARDGAPFGAELGVVEVRFESVEADGRAARVSSAGKTGAEGQANVKVPAPAAGQTLVLRASTSVAPRTTEVLVESMSPEGAVLIVKVPDAVADALEGGPGKGEGRASAAAKALRDLARQVAVVYWVDPAWTNARDLRERLDARGLPRGPIVGLDGPTDESIGARLDRLGLARLQGARFAVVTRSAEAHQFAYRGIHALVFGLGHHEARVTSVDSWAEVARKVLRGGQ